MYVCAYIYSADHLVVAAVDGVVGTLEETELAILRKFERLALLPEEDVLKLVGWDDDGGCDVVLLIHDTDSAE
jgi:hypothetical protein